MRYCSWVLLSHRHSLSARKLRPLQNNTKYCDYRLREDSYKALMARIDQPVQRYVETQILSPRQARKRFPRARSAHDFTDQNNTRGPRSRPNHQPQIQSAPATRTKINVPSRTGSLAGKSARLWDFIRPRFGSMSPVTEVEPPPRVQFLGGILERAMQRRLARAENSNNDDGQNDSPENDRLGTASFTLAPRTYAQVASTRPETSNIRA